MIDPKVLDPIVGAYEKNLATLRDQNSILRNDVNRLADSLDIMMDDNKKLREQLKKKNVDISNTIQTIGLEEGENLMNLKQHVKLLEEENTSLTFKVTQLKELLDNERQQAITGDDELLNCNFYIKSEKSDKKEG